MSRQSGTSHHKAPPARSSHAKANQATHVLPNLNRVVCSAPRTEAESAHSRIQNAEPERRDGASITGRYVFASPESERDMCKNRWMTKGRMADTGTARYRIIEGGEGNEEEAKNVTWQ